MKGYDGKPTMTTEEAAEAAGVDAATFVRLARCWGSARQRPKPRRNGRIWSEWDAMEVRRGAAAVLPEGA